MLLYSCNPGDKAEIEKSASAFDMAQGKASILQGNQSFMKAFKAGDSTGVANNYTTDGKIMPANSPAIVGRDNIQHFISSIMSGGIKDFQLVSINIWGDSSILAEEGSYKIADSTDNQVDRGKYIVLWKKESGNWKMFRDIWTSDISEPALVQKKAKNR